MPIRVRKGRLEWRFWVDGHEYSKLTDLADTARNRTKAQRMEADARRLVMEGRGNELRLEVQPFSSAADAFIMWAQGEYRQHSGSWKRLRGSMTSARLFFGKRPLSSVTAGDLEDYKSLRRGTHGVRDVTLRHDLHALSLLFQYSAKHNWCKGNPVREVEIPGDADAVRMHVLTPAEERQYFDAIEQMRLEQLAINHKCDAESLQDLADLSRLMLHQGCRPEELRALLKEHVNLEAGTLTIIAGKSLAARRTLRLTAISRQILARRLQSPGPWVFPSRRHHKGQHVGVHQRLHGDVLERLTFRFVPYDLRHTAATRWGESGVDIATIAKWLGHANLRTVQKYIHISEQHQFAEAERFEKLWTEKTNEQPIKPTLQ